MNAFDALRATDPARQLPPFNHDKRDEALLQQILESPMSSSTFAALNSTGTSRPQRHGWRPVLVTAAVTVVLAVGSVAAIRSANGARPVPAHSTSTSITIGSLPKRSSLLIRGTAPLRPLDSATKQDLDTYATQNGLDPATVRRDYAAQHAFDEVSNTAERADASFADAVFTPGVRGASVLRFGNRPPQTLIDDLIKAYPRELRIEWGDHLVGDAERDAFSQTVFNIVNKVPHAGHPTTGIDADGRLIVSYTGDADLHTIADAILNSAAFQQLYINGQPPTAVRITHQAPASTGINELPGIPAGTGINQLPGTPASTPSAG